jgi:hypothetical protein
MNWILIKIYIENHQILLYLFNQYKLLYFPQLLFIANSNLDKIQNLVRYTFLYFFIWQVISEKCYEMFHSICKFTR